MLELVKKETDLFNVNAKRKEEQIHLIKIR
ncbi:hypothetical protein C823_006782 [Eubacterium plexicaudatum ASF492]|nr:hypothetical protein C823_006782 [Eubacterium plexicaudatum ASF492]